MELFGLFNRKKSEPDSLSFFGHIDVLRGHLFRSVIVLVIMSVVLFCFPEFLFDTILFGPLKNDFITYRAFCKLGHMVNVGDQLCFGNFNIKLQSLGLADQFTSHMWIAMIGGLTLSAPYILFEIWKFFHPAEKEKEKKGSVGFIAASSSLFIIGVLFSYFIIIPLSINFLADYKVSERFIQNNFTMDSYISLTSTLTLATGIVFELPVIVYFLSRFGLMTPEFMKKYRKHAVVVILVVAAIVTPSPDVTSQMLVAFPLYLLYEASIFISRRVVKKRNLST